jgi:O-acetyl-ADP-ribose deacetylase (regulator of RNase III)
MTRWTNASVRALAGEDDPLAVVSERARTLVFEAIDAGWPGPPFDPLWLADHLDIRVVPRDDVFDARLVSEAAGVRIEYNPQRPSGRRRFSLAHEIAHLLFPDHADAVRNREHVTRGLGDEWQLEALCNLAAAELLMPVAALNESDVDVGLDGLLRLRQRFDVSTEAILLRAMRLTTRQAAMFAAAPTSPERSDRRYRIDYSKPSRSWRSPIPTGLLVPTDSVIATCSAVGSTATSEAEAWVGASHRVECVGVPAYPGHRYPRVVGLVAQPTPSDAADAPTLRYAVGDAAHPRGQDRKILVLLVNDKARRWRGGFPAAVRRRWPQVAEAYTKWTSESPDEFRLGATFLFDADDTVTVAALVAQHGYGPSSRGPRIRYEALRQTLATVGRLAAKRGASVHMPRLGTGQAGGQWPIIEALVTDEIVDRGVTVTVYDPVNATDQGPRQLALET